MKRRIDIIPVPSALGAPDGGVAGGPEALRHAGLLTALHRGGHEATWVPPLYPLSRADRCDALAELCERLAGTVAASGRAGRLPVVIGGDHAIAAGTWRGTAAAMAGPPGLLWIDAHLDAHVAEDSVSGNLHGMPLALLLGAGDPRLASDVLSPRHVCVLGARQWEPEEMLRLRRFGVRVIDDAEIARRGFAEVLREATERVATGTAGFGITCDLDVFSPDEAPGVSTPAAGGQPAADWLAALRGLAARPDCVAVEIVECDGARDRDDRTARLAVRLAAELMAPAAADLVALEAAHGAANYDPLPVVLARAEGCRVWDVDGREYLDMMSAYSAASFGHGHPRLVAALADQARRLAVTSRAYYNDVLPAFLRRLTELTGYERALPVNTGVEAVETALKAARKWGCTVKGIAPERAEIIACEGNFHGRTIAVVGLSSEAQYRCGFGPFPPGLKQIPYGVAAALDAAITPNTAAFLVEPIQGEGGIVVPPPGYLAACADICRRRNVLLICDEVQTGLGRTGRLLACEHEGVRPDGVVLGKALGGGLYPVSAFLADRRVMDVFHPGDHGSTFGGNALAAAVGLAALDLLVEERLSERTAELGQWLLARLRALNHPLIREVRGRGLLIGFEVDVRYVHARDVAEALLGAGILTKDTHGTVIRLTPPLVIAQRELEWAVGRIGATLDNLRAHLPRAA
ncbi:MAG: ornithine--oxo-acid transaminase [Betaproteobacteria bacterium]|nr:ornithine--oxo-acid transaminase [Betaproteobacteria bacterium]